MSWNSRSRRSSFGQRESRLGLPFVFVELGILQVADGDANRGQRRAQVVADRREQRRREVRPLLQRFGGLSLEEKCRALDRNRDHAGERVE